MNNTWFVTGIDTDVGKTICTGWLASLWIQKGHQTITQKLVQTGACGYSPDIAMHRKIMGMDFQEDDEGLTAPEIYSYPCSPHLASELDKRPLNLERILQANERLSSRYERVLLEGAGGIMVPLTQELLTIDLIAQKKWPVVFVTSGKLGCISHTLLSFEAMKNRSIELSHLIFNDWHPAQDPIIDEDAFKYIVNRAKEMWPTAQCLRCPKLTL